MTMHLAQAGWNLFVAGFLGAAIGLERQWRQHFAGLRTNTLVALGAAIFITYSRIVFDDHGAAQMAAQVVAGIGFLGAGVIFKEGANVRGINTAATLWCSAGVGLLAGEGFAAYGLMAGLLVIGANTILRPFVYAIKLWPLDSTGDEQQYHITINCGAARVSEIRSQLVDEVAALPDLKVSKLDSALVRDTDRVEVLATVTSHMRRERAVETIVGRFGQADGVSRAVWRLNQQAA